MNENVTALIPIHRTKGNREWLQQAVNSLGGAKILVLENDGELAEALNAGLREAKTEFVLPFGADDLACPQMLDYLLALAWNGDVVYPAMTLVDESLIPTGDHDADPFCGNRLLIANFVSGASLLRRSKALEVGGWRQLEGLEDWDLFVRMYRAGAHFKPCPHARLLYRIHEGGRNVRAREDEALRASLREQIVGEAPTPLATFYSQATPATTYLRCQLPARHLPGIVFPHVMAAFSEGDEVRFPDLHGDAAIFQFPGDQARAIVSQVMRAEGVRVLVEADDNYLLNPGTDIINRSGWSLEIGGKPSSRQGHRWIAKHADGVIVTTPLLADAYRKVNTNVYVCPNTVDPADWPEPEKLDDGVFRIAWMASKSHLVDIPLVTRAMEWASGQKDVEVYVCGFNPGWKFDYRYLDWIDDLDGYRASFRQFDVGLAPIRRLPFALYRSDVKALEIAMGLGCPVLSDVAPYADWRDGENCLKAADAKGFYHAIKHLVTHRDEAKQLAQAAREYTLAERTTAAQIGLWEEAIAG